MRNRWGVNKAMVEKKLKQIKFSGKSNDEIQRRIFDFKLKSSIRRSTNDHMTDAFKYAMGCDFSFGSFKHMKNPMGDPRDYPMLHGDFVINPKLQKQLEEAVKDVNAACLDMGKRAGEIINECVKKMKNNQK